MIRWHRIPKRLLFSIGLVVTGYYFYGFSISTYNSSHVNNNNNCKPRNHIVFLKTHKTGGSTIQNILMRYGYTHDLLFLLPVSGNYFGHPEPFSEDMVPMLKPEYHYSILTHHTRFNYTAVKAVMPKDSVFTTLLRDPVFVFESAYSYYDLTNEYGLDLDYLVRINVTGTSLASRRYQGRIGRNQMAFDLGVDPKDFDNATTMEKLAMAIEEQFDLVMINEMFEESLVLLKDLMCWDWYDVVAFRLNSRAVRSRKRVPRSLARDICNWNRLDQNLYSHFVEVLRKKIENYGRSRMEMDVRRLRKITEDWYEFCVSSQYKMPGTVVFEFLLNEKSRNNGSCRNLASNELQFTELLQRKQRRHIRPYSLVMLQKEERMRRVRQQRV